jgi:hypothetical protein
LHKYLWPKKYDYPLMWACVLGIIVTLAYGFWWAPAKAKQPATSAVSNTEVVEAPVNAKVAVDNGQDQQLATFLNRGLSQTFVSRPYIADDDAGYEAVFVENTPDIGDQFTIACYDLDRDNRVKDQITGEAIARFEGVSMYLFAVYIYKRIDLMAHAEELPNVEVCETVDMSNGQFTGRSNFWSLPGGTVARAQALTASSH